MKKKILLIIGIAIFLIPNICLAKTITIDNQDYSTTGSIDKENFSYDANRNTLTLKNATFKSISTEENLKIILEGKNYFNNSSLVENDYLIKAKDLEITGNGTLEVETSGRFVYSRKVTINNTTLKIKSTSDTFSLKDYDSGLCQDLIVNNSNLEIESTKYIFNYSLGNIYFINSKVNINKAEKVDGGILNINVINSNLNVKEVNSFTFSGSIFVSGNSNVYVHALENKVPNKNYTLIGSNLKFLESTDGNTWSDASSSSKPSYLKIVNTESREYLDELGKTLKEKENTLNEKERTLNLKEKELEEKENKLGEREESLNSKELELKDKEETLNAREEYLSNNAFKLNNLEFELFNKNVELEETRNNLLTLENGLSLKEEELNNKDLNLNEKKSKLDELQELLKSKQEELEKEKTSLETRGKELEAINEKLALLEEYETSLNQREEEVNREEENVTYRVKNNNNDIIKTVSTVEKPKKQSKVVLFSGLTFVVLIGLTSLILVLRRKSGDIK